MWWCLLRRLIVMGVVSGTALWTAIVGSWSFAQSGGGGDAKKQIELHNGMLSVNVRDVAMNDVFLIIGEQEGVMVSFCGKLDNVKAQAFQNIPLEEGIRKLAENNDVDIIKIYGPERRLMEVRAYK